MAAYAYVEDGVVTNLIEYDGARYDGKSKLIALAELPAGVSIGWRMDGSEWIAPDSDPEMLRQRQASIAASQGSSDK